MAVPFKFSEVNINHRNHFSCEESEAQLLNDISDDDEAGLESAFPAPSVQFSRQPQHSVQ